MKSEYCGKKTTPLCAMSLNQIQCWMFWPFLKKKAKKKELWPNFSCFFEIWQKKKNERKLQTKQRASEGYWHRQWETDCSNPNRAWREKKNKESEESWWRWGEERLKRKWSRTVLKVIFFLPSSKIQRRSHSFQEKAQGRSFDLKSCKSLWAVIASEV